MFATFVKKFSTSGVYRINSILTPAQVAKKIIFIRTG